jgi:hypothetical protein
MPGATVRAASLDKEVFRHHGGDDRDLDHFPPSLHTPTDERPATPRTRIECMEHLSRRLHPPPDKPPRPPLAPFLRRARRRVHRFETGHPLRASRPIALPFRLQRRHGGKQLPDALRQRCHGRFQCDDPLLLRDDHPLLALDGFVLGNDEPDQIIPAGILEINHAISIACPLIPEQIPNCQRISQCSMPDV